MVHKGAVSLTRADSGTVAIVTSDGRMIVVSLNTSSSELHHSQYLGFSEVRIILDVNFLLL